MAVFRNKQVDLTVSNHRTIGPMDCCQHVACIIIKVKSTGKRHVLQFDYLYRVSLAELNSAVKHAEVYLGEVLRNLSHTERKHIKLLGTNVKMCEYHRTKRVLGHHVHVWALRY